MPLLDPLDVQNLLPQYHLSDDQLDVAMRIVAGWLREDSGRTDVSDLTDADPLWSPAVELVGLIAENPTSLASKTAGPTSRTWPLAPQRDRIRAAVRGAAARASGGPRGTFPPAQPWPDPALPGCS